MRFLPSHQLDSLYDGESGEVAYLPQTERGEVSFFVCKAKIQHGLSESRFVWLFLSARVRGGPESCAGSAGHAMEFVFLMAEKVEAREAVAFVGFGAFFDAVLEKAGLDGPKPARRQEEAISWIAPCSTSSAGLSLS